MDGRIQSEFYNDKGNGLPFYQGKKEFQDRFIGKPKKWTTKITKEAVANDILMSVRAPVGPVNFATQECCIGRGLAAIRCSNLINKDFGFYYLKSKEDELEGSNGAVFNSINKTQIGNIPIPIPPLAEQKQIVALLDQAFAAIDQAKANIEQNIANAKELFQSKLNEIFSQEGDGWEEKRLGEVCEIASKLINPREPGYRKLLHVGGGNIVSETGEFIDLKTAEEEGLKSGKFAFTKEVVLYNKIRPYLVKVARPNFNGLCSADMYPLTPDEGKITKDFLYFLLISNNFTKYAISGSSRAGMPKVNRKHLFGYTFSLPSIKIQNVLIAALNSLQKESKAIEDVYQKKNAFLEELKKSLLQKAFAGELTPLSESGLVGLEDEQDGIQKILSSGKS